MIEDQNDITELLVRTGHGKFELYRVHHAHDAVRCARILNGHVAAITYGSPKLLAEFRKQGEQWEILDEYMPLCVGDAWVMYRAIKVEEGIVVDVTQMRPRHLKSLSDSGERWVLLGETEKARIGDKWIEVE